MSKFAANHVYDKQNKLLVSSTFKKAFISSINITSFTADVIFAENPTNTIRSVPLGSHIDPTKIIVGDRCRVDVFDETNQRDMVVAYIYGRKMS